jgi:hypothetical protein
MQFNYPLMLVGYKLLEDKGLELTFKFHPFPLEKYLNRMEN